MRIETQLESDKIYARPNRLLRDHLSNVADKALSFLPPHLSDIAYRAGLWHDLGKYRPEWQKYLQANIDKTWTGRKVPHAIHGAILAYRLKLPSVAFAIAGHHSGLHNIDKLAEKVRNSESTTETEEAIAKALTELDLKQEIEPEKGRDEFTIRMLFSALVDADRLDAGHEPPQQWTIDGLNIDAIPPNDNPINQLRSQFFQKCQDAAIGKPGVYRITGPCGIGKTRSMMQFGLKHSQENGMRGVVYCSPFCSVLDQSYNTYKDLLGEENIIPSWSTFELDGNEEELKAYQLLAERWDAPIILTTTVNFFDSILSNKPGKLRKIHQLQNRCIILDEVQSFPRSLLSTILSVLSNLVNNWGCTVVLSSATNPAFEQLGNDFNLPVVDVIPKQEVNLLFKKLSRCNFIHWKEPTTFEAIADDIHSTTGSALVVVNTKKLAKDGFNFFRFQFNQVWHLSTYMCPAHRQKILDEAKTFLSNGEGVLISTSLIEAGVDIDCDRGYRQFVGIDSIYQTSGRVNRNGIKQNAELIIFDIEGYRAFGDMKSRTDITKQLFRKELSLDDPRVFQEFFSRYYAGKNNRDERGIEQLRKEFKFEEVANEFKMINSITQPVLVSYDAIAKRLIKKIEESPDKLSSKDIRLINKYVVCLKENEIENFIEKNKIKKVNGFNVWMGGYNKDSGIDLKDEDFEFLIV